ncbi:MAG: stage III sporulation protein AD [Lachnospiraceae bacterium]|nr:stage III sporulation protein AD [Lachnospiraceae bacterium]
MSVFSISVLGVVTMLLALQLTETKREYGLYLSLACCLVIFFYSLSKVQIVIDTVSKFAAYVNLNTTYLSILIKIVGIAYLSEFSADLCRDAGHQAIAGQIQVFSKLSILAISMPIITALLDTIQSFG